MAGSIFPAGYLIIHSLFRSGRERLKTADVYFVTGILFVTVYAQLFSLFYKVGALACTCLFCLEALAVVLYAVRHKKRRLQRWRLSPSVCGALIVLLAVLAVTIRYAVQTTWHYDTGLYHAQAIQWIEKYGVVPGLGNLHERFAYNSSFMVLQALYSLSWFWENGQSLHTLNSFLAVMGLTYAIASMGFWKERHFRRADLFRCVMICCIVYGRMELSSCGTDMWALMLVVYLCMKWAEIIEAEEETLDLRCFLCVVSVYAVTVKLSAATSLVLAVWPIVYLLKNRDWKRIAGCCGAGLFTAAPFLLRNVILSGYLVYPMTSIDLFPVDWKMSKALAKQDKDMIILYGRGGSHELEALEKPVWEWMPEWFLALETPQKLLAVLGAAAFAAGLVMLLLCLRKRRYDDALLLSFCALGLVYWMMTAPLMRYGFAYLLLMIAAVMYERQGKGWEKAAALLWLTAVVVMLFFYVKDAAALKMDKKLVWPDGYANFAGEEQQCGDTVIYVPTEDDRIGYYYFPSTPYRGRLEDIELRGAELSEGFRWISGN